MVDEIEKVSHFQPPMYQQRYLFAINMLTSDKWSKQVHKIIDFGCGEISLFRYLRNSDNIHEVLFVDVDRSILIEKHRRIQPLMSDYLRKRPNGLYVRVIHADIRDFHSEFHNTDAVIMLEVIEHLPNEILKSFPANVFGKIRPKLVIISTPNSEYNQFFTNFKNVRHPDHKFEWTRQQFRDWSNKILTQYGQYDVEFVDLGFLPDKDPDRQFGGSTQVAVFSRRTTNDTIKDTVEFADTTYGPFEIIAAVDFPK